jgi:pimeloyl-ACP methyl ester carboxylesterase
MDAVLVHEPRRRMIRLPDGEMAALEFGDAGRPVDVVFLHANGFNAATYRSVLSPLSLSMRILACDLRGHGASRLPADPEPRRTWSVFRDDLLALMEQLGPTPLVLAGHSMGAVTALLAAERAQDRVKGLVLFEPVILSRLGAAYARLPWAAGGGWLRRLPLARTAARRRAVFDSPQDAFRSYSGRGAFRTWPETVLADYLSAGLRERGDGRVELACAPAWEAANFAAQANDARRCLTTVERPIALYRAERGSTCETGAGAGLMRRNRNLRIETVPGSTHFLPMERPDVVREALLDAVSG